MSYLCSASFSLPELNFNPSPQLQLETLTVNARDSHGDYQYPMQSPNREPVSVRCVELYALIASDTIATVLSSWQAGNTVWVSQGTMLAHQQGLPCLAFQRTPRLSVSTALLTRSITYPPRLLSNPVSQRRTSKEVKAEVDIFSPVVFRPARWGCLFPTCSPAPPTPRMARPAWG